MAYTSNSRLTSRLSAASRLNSNSRYNNVDESSGSSSGLWIISIILIVLTVIAIFAGTYYKRYEGFENANKNYILQYYYMPECGHCTDFNNNVWSKLESNNEANPEKYKFKLEKYDITDNGKGAEKAKKYGINSTPTIYLYNSQTDKKVEFKKERTETDLLKFVDETIVNWN